MYWYEIIATVLMIAGGIILGSLVTLFVTYKVMFSDRVMKKIAKKSLKMTAKMIKHYNKMLEE